MAAAVGQFGNLDTFPANSGFTGNDGTNYYTTVCFPSATTVGSTLLLHCGVYPGTGTHITAVSDPVNGSWGSPLESIAPTSSGNGEMFIYAKQNAASVPAGSQGQCTSANTTTLTDSSKTWSTNQWSGKTLLDLNTGATHTVSSNTATVLTFPSGTAPTSGDFYVVGSFIKITLNTVSSIFYNFAQCTEVTGASPSATIVHTSADASSGTGGSNVISSGAASCTVPGLMVGISANLTGTQAAPYSPSVDTGGGFTLLDFYFVADNGPSTATGATTEYQYFASAPGSKAATFGLVASSSDCPAFMVFIPDSSSGFTLTAGNGSYGLTGEAATLLFNPKYLLSSSFGSYAYTGEPASFVVASKLTAAFGAYALTGESATFSDASFLVGAKGNYSYTGLAATLNWGATYLLTAGSGSFVISGQAVNLPENTYLPLGFGSFAITGEATKLGTGVQVAAGSYSLTGEAANLSANLGGFTLSAAKGNYAYTGSDAGLVYGITYLLTAASGTYVLTGESATLVEFIPGFSLTAAQGAFTLTGEAATFSVTQPILVAGTGLYVLTGDGAILVYSGAGGGINQEYLQKYVGLNLIKIGTL